MSDVGSRAEQDWQRLTDAELLAASAAEPEAFGVFYDRHVHSVLRFLVRQTKSADMATELTSETFAKAFASRRRFRDVGAPARAWILGIAQHEVKKWLRRGRVDDRARRRLGVSTVIADDESLERIEAMVDFEPTRTAVRAALDMLKPAVRDALILRIGLDLPYSEVASHLRCSEGAARVRVTRGLRQLSLVMEEVDGS